MPTNTIDKTVVAELREMVSEYNRLAKLGGHDDEALAIEQEAVVLAEEVWDVDTLYDIQGVAELLGPTT